MLGLTKSRKKRTYSHIFFKICMICFFIGGFVYQTMEFLLLYWTYPTVVDIQQSSPSYIEIPAFTFCSRSGYIYKNLCKLASSVRSCSSLGLPVMKKFTTEIICKQFPQVCVKGGTELPKGFKAITFEQFMKKYSIQRKDFDYIAVPLEQYLNCTIEFAGQLEKCNLENVLGSFYTLDDLPQFCYTIYSKWGNPDKVREKIPKGAKMRLEIFVNISQRAKEYATDLDQYDAGFPGPLFNPPTKPTVQVAVHSPYFLPSPYIEGDSFIGGRDYELHIKLSERHLLEAPYQTNCTNYMTLWRQRGGKAPVNQLNMIQECRMNTSFEELGCVPVSIDYPHAYNICKSCDASDPDDPCEHGEPENNCTLLAEHYNQPCNSLIYEVNKEDKVITYFQKLESEWAVRGGIKVTIDKYDCEGHKIFRPECSTIHIDVPFDRFEITNITYNAKFESLELFSVIGGYMGMWLGISLLAIFQFIDESVVSIKTYFEKKKKKERRIWANKRHIHPYENFRDKRYKESFSDRIV